MSYPSQFLDLQNAVIAKLRLDPTSDRAKVRDWINQVYVQAVVETGSNQTYQSTTLTAGTSTYTLPTAIFEIDQIVLTPSDQSTPNRPLELVTLATLLDRRSGGPVGSPACYAMVGDDQFEVSPIPTAADTLTFWYTAQPTPLSADSDVPDLSEPYASKLLEYGALAEGADFKMDPRMDEYRALFEQWQGKYRRHLRRKQGGVATQIPRYRARLPAHSPSQDMGW